MKNYHAILVVNHEAVETCITAKNLKEAKKQATIARKARGNGYVSGVFYVQNEDTPNKYHSKS